NVSGVVTRSPAWRGDALGFLARLDVADCEGRRVSAGTLARLYGGPRTLSRGDRFEGVAQLGVVRLFRNIDLADPRLFASRQGAVVSGSLLAVEVTARGGGLAARVDAFRAHVRG